MSKKNKVNRINGHSNSKTFKLSLLLLASNLYVLVWTPKKSTKLISRRPVVTFKYSTKSASSIQTQIIEISYFV